MLEPFFLLLQKKKIRICYTRFAFSDISKSVSDECLPEPSGSMWKSNPCYLHSPLLLSIPFTVIVYWCIQLANWACATSITLHRLCRNGQLALSCYMHLPAYCRCHRHIVLLKGKHVVFSCSLGMQRLETSSMYPPFSDLQTHAFEITAYKVYEKGITLSTLYFVLDSNRL